MNYRILQMKKDHFENQDSESELMTIAKWHNLTPKLWNPEFRITSEVLTETIEKIINTDQEDLYLAFAKSDEGILQGFIWAYKQEKPINSAIIKSLYVEKQYRNQGIARALKVALEEWCKKGGLEIIQTTVHYKNENMIKLNQKLGYQPGMVCMIRNLNEVLKK